MEAILQALIAAASSFVFVCLLVALLLLVCRRPPKPHLFHAPPPWPPPPPQRAPAADESAAFDPSLDRISMTELAAATRNFAPDAIIGDGGFGFVYKARLASGAVVAVKRLSADACHGLREFRAEMDTLGRIRHRNLARLLGYCAAGADRVLIYEFLERGSLDNWLHGESAGPGRLPWAARLVIARGVAAGLAFLHGERIIHRDIKSSNVLLDADFAARIADFGLARRVDSARSHVSTQAAGTMGYMAPEYRDGATAATAAADAYSFGALAWEVATGRRPSWPVREEGGRESSLVRWARRTVEEGRGLEIVDRLMGSEGWTMGEVEGRQIEGLLDVAYRCTEESARERPSMCHVAKLLDQL